MSKTAADLAGQSMMLRFHGPELTNTAREAFHEIRPGGVILFSDNIASRTQVHGLTAELQAEARRLGLPPLLIAADQEGGIVSRFSTDFVTPPGPMALAASKHPDDIEIAARITAEQLREVGINVNFAPAIDVNNNPDNPVIRTRSFGDTPERVIACLEGVLRGHESARVVTTVKHFPGHGDTSIDSHLGLPTIPWERARIDQIELAPFRAAIAMGVPAVMSAHVLFPALDKELPATLSDRILTGLLRGELGFAGAIFTDAMNMRAITDGYGLVESTILAKLAGVDMLEANESIADQHVRHSALIDALESGRIPGSIFEATVDRLTALRHRYDITGEPTPLSRQLLSRRETALEIASRTIVHQGRASFEPVTSAGTLIVDFQRLRTTEAEDPVGRARVLKDAVTRHLPGAEVITLNEDLPEKDVEDATARAATASTLVILTRDASDLPAQAQHASAIVDAVSGSARVVHCAMRGPYDAGVLSRADDMLFTFGDPAVSIEALVAVLAGATRPSGHMPVQVPALGSV